MRQIFLQLGVGPSRTRVLVQANILDVNRDNVLTLSCFSVKDEAG